MKKNEDKSGLKLSRMRGFLILILGVVFFTSGMVINKRSENKGINSIMGFGIVAMVVGAGLQIWDMGRKKEV